MNEIQMISTTMWSIDSIHNTVIATRLSELMAKRNDEFTSTIFDAYTLPKKRSRVFDHCNDEQVALFEQCISNEKELTIMLTNSDRKKREVLFGFTIDFAPEFTVVTFQVTHSYFVAEGEKTKYMSIVKELIGIINPIYAKIDDIGESLEILDKSGEDTYQCVIDYVPAIFWGNYFGEKYIQQYGKDKLLSSPYGIISNVGNGILITMNDDPMIYNTKECSEDRKRLSKYLHVGKPNPIKKLFGL